MQKGAITWSNDAELGPWVGDFKTAWIGARLIPLALLRLVTVAAAGALAAHVVMQQPPASNIPPGGRMLPILSEVVWASISSGLWPGC